MLQFAKRDGHIISRTYKGDDNVIYVNVQKLFIPRRGVDDVADGNTKQHIKEMVLMTKGGRCRPSK